MGCLLKAHDLWMTATDVAMEAANRGPIRVGQGMAARSKATITGFGGRGAENLEINPMNQTRLSHLSHAPRCGAKTSAFVDTSLFQLQAAARLPGVRLSNMRV
jgi:hypothetical protein